MADIKDIEKFNYKTIPLSVIEDIKAEIRKKHLSIIENNDFDNGRTYGYDECLAIIDKQIKESEVNKQ